MRGIRIFWRILKEAYHGVVRSGLSNFMVVSILAVALALLGGVLQLNSSIKQISQNLDNQLEFSVYLKDSAVPKEIAKSISTLERVEKVEVVPKEVAWERFRQRFEFSDKAGNPLPNTLHVNLKSPDSFDPVIEKVKQLSGIEQISYAPELFNGLERVRSILFSLGILLTLILAFGTITIVSNTIQLVIKTRSLEIEILRLVGVDDWYIRGPFIFHGVFYGFISSIFAFLPLIFFQKVIWDSFQSSFRSIMPLTFNFDSGNDLMLIYFVMTITGILVCGISSYLTTEKYIRV